MKKSAVAKSEKLGKLELNQVVKSLEQIGVKVTFAQGDKPVNHENISLIAGHSNKELFIR